MKVKINTNGDMKITPENPEEDLVLKEWYKNNARVECRRVILFERFGEKES